MRYDQFHPGLVNLDSFAQKELAQEQTGLADLLESLKNNNSEQYLKKPEFGSDLTAKRELGLGLGKETLDEESSFSMSPQAQSASILAGAKLAGDLGSAWAAAKQQEAQSVQQAIAQKKASEQSAHMRSGESQRSSLAGLINAFRATIR